MQIILAASITMRAMENDVVELLIEDIINRIGVFPAIGNGPRHVTWWTEEHMISVVFKDTVTVHCGYMFCGRYDYCDPAFPDNLFESLKQLDNHFRFGEL